MKKNLIIYESHYGTAKRASVILSLICGYAKACDVRNVKADLNLYDNVIFVVGFHGIDTADEIKKYINKYKEILVNKTIAYIAIGLSQRGSENYLRGIEDSLGRKIDYENFIHGEIRVKKLSEEDKETLKLFLASQNMKLIDMGKFKDEEAVKVSEEVSNFINKNNNAMKREDLKKEIDKFILSHNTCSLATGSCDFMRCTPIEYQYVNDNLYFITEGGKKFKGIIANGKAAVAIYDSYSGFGSLKGLQIEGNTEIILNDSKEYKDIMDRRGVKEEFLSKSPVNMNVLKLKVNKFEFLNSDFKKLGFDTKQIYK